MKKVLIADDQKLFADMLKKIIETYSDFFVLPYAGNGHEAYLQYQLHLPDICLFDIQMPQTDGIYALKSIKKEFPEARVIMLTTFDNDENVLDAYLNGADGYLLKDIVPDALIDAMHCVLAGQCVINKRIQEFVVKLLSNTLERRVAVGEFDADLDVAFQKRDIEIICLISKGMSNKAIAAKLNYSEGTVRNRISNILSTTGLKDRTQIALFAIKNKLL